MKAGLYTSEFWLSVLVVTAAVVLALFDKIDGDQAMLAVGGVTSAYALSRGAAKINPPKDSETFGDAENVTRYPVGD